MDVDGGKDGGSGDIFTAAAEEEVGETYDDDGGIIGT